ncbi:hypothetical protein Cgig2_023661 [Carnegiea gigantea]|uniref:Uncharacterized protein n=1 Tax=Carnegiea gigantea TaxID=171969 RepID=A0A9Q1QJ63_9CARY|nr:hypothetical protein Cgig2_023661 [Carnegiea gigantea]
MAFPRSLSTREMVKYVAYHFKWDRCGIAFPPSPLSEDFRALCLNYELAVVEEAAGRFELPKLSQIIFYAMLLNEAERLGVLHGRTLRIMESVLPELRWSTFESWVWLNGDQIFAARLRAKTEKKKDSSRVRQEEEDSKAEREEEGSEAEKEEEGSAPGGWPPLRTTTGENHGIELNPPLFVMAFPPLRDTREMADFAACDFGLPEMVHATFYAMLLNNAARLGLVDGFIAASLKASLKGLQWLFFESWILRSKHNLLEVQLRPRPVPGGAQIPANDLEESSGANNSPLSSSDEE